MNTLAIKQILCFGDSNTWGQKSSGTKGRYAPNQRWTGRLQAALGQDYNIIEEGLPSRTTNLDYTAKPGRNGQAYLVPCLASQSPLDLIVLMLGTNDLKIEFHRSAKEVAVAIAELIADCKKHGFTAANAAPPVLVVSPILVNAATPRFAELYEAYYGRESEPKSKQLAGEIEAVATQNGCAFFDATSVASAGEDGIHMNENSHAALAAALEAEVKQLV